MSRRRRRSLPVGPDRGGPRPCAFGWPAGPWWATIRSAAASIVVVKLPTGDLAKPDTKSEVGAKPETGKFAAERAGK